MSNIEIYASLVNGGVFQLLENGEGCNILVETVLGDDLRPPPSNLTIKVKTDSGKNVTVIIPNDYSSKAIVQIEGESI
ncbi:MAG: hypothetical protein OQK04_19370 [Kangiellaceae bacterium]|nr:hypothetical protein [Kangiellaceae bacterium]MCW9000880.1 hypothetical protein [Kangiellaceae bacterium]